MGTSSSRVLPTLLRKERVVKIVSDLLPAAARYNGERSCQRSHRPGRRWVMGQGQSRRRFLQTAATGGAILGLGDLGFLGRLPSLGAAEVQRSIKRVPLPSEVEPLVRLL